jgi:hypothetical protein
MIIAEEQHRAVFAALKPHRRTFKDGPGVHSTPPDIATANREHCCVGTDSCASLQLGGIASQTNLPSGRRTPVFLKLVKICVGFGPSARARKDEKTPSFGKSRNFRAPDIG